MAKKKPQIEDESGKPIAVFDFETDPFEHGATIEPFCAGYYDGSEYAEFWGDDCHQRLVEHWATIKEPHLIYAHNGGKFDFFYLLRLGVLENPIKIINGRIVQAKVGIHTLRDSFAILPIPLGAYQKDGIDYALMKKHCRNKHKKEILKYLKSDCEYLFALVKPFVARFGPRLTIGGTAIKELEKFHPFERLGAKHDESFRSYYFGGRVSCFESGIITGDFKIYDVNSMYPDAMKNRLHPCGQAYTTYTRNILDKNGFINGRDREKPYFITFEGKNFGALPVRTKQGLDFNCPAGLFQATSHEIQVALKYQKIKIEKVIEIRVPHDTISFGDFVDTFNAEKVAAKISKDKVTEIFSKLILNSSYGKFCTNPANFHDYIMSEPGENAPNNEKRDESGTITSPNTWVLFADYGEFEIYKKPINEKLRRYFDVAIGASITGASRAKLLEAICNAKRPIYCDTDSLICEDLGGNVEIDRAKLGAWKHEGDGNTIAIAGKKLYAVFTAPYTSEFGPTKNKRGELVKMASKGIKATPQQILHAATGGRIDWNSEAPNFKLDGRTLYISRALNKDGEILHENVDTDF